LELFKIVNWVTKFIGVKSAKSPLKESEFGSIIVDVRDLKDGVNDPNELVKALQRLFTVVAFARQYKSPVIIQCEAGLSRSTSLIAAIFVKANDMEWEDALEFVKKKVPEAQFNQDLLDCLKAVLETI
jgi:protein-tyrosine phosphatase